MKSVMLAEPTTIVLFGGFILFLVFLLALIGAAVFLIVHFSRRKKIPVPPHSPPPTVHMANGRRYFKMGLLLLLLAGMTAVICLLLPTRSQGSVEVLGQSEFFHAVESNRIASASITYAASGSSLARITGTYKQRDPFNNQTEARYVVEKILLSEKMRDALIREAGSVEIIEPNPNTYWNLIWTIAPFLMVVLMGLALGAIAFFVIRRAFKNGMASPVPPMIPQTERMFRKCPQCGAELKPDVSEGLCPACLLQRGIATEGGAPPGTPPFTPPTIPDLAKLFPQLEILELIGKGGMGAVYKARQPALDRFVALKILAPRTGGDLDFASRFTREARALAKLSHPNIVAVYDFGQAGSLSYFIMEHVDGPNLRQIEQTGKLPPREALEIIPQICAALQFAHDEGIVHRDIKPENILLDKKGRVKIADFGLAKILGSEPKDFRLTGARDVVGTPHYMAPEQVEKPQEVDHRADIYSLGVVFYEMLTGELPLGKFQPPSSCARGIQIDVRLDEVVLHALEKEPARRYQQVSEVKTQVEIISRSKPNSKPKMSMKKIIVLFTIIAILGISLTYEVVQHHRILQSLKSIRAQQPALNSRQQALRERFVQQDRGKYTAQQLREAEALYLVANQKWGTPEAKQSLQKMIDKFPDLINRTGCAVLYLAQMSQGDERAQYLQDCIDKYNDCFYDDGVLVGAYARFILAEDYKSQGETDKARVLFDEIKSKYPDAIDHRGELLVDSLKADSK
jgi:serine/threonine protein kinase